MISRLAKVKREIIVVVLAILVQFFGAMPLKPVVENMITSKVITSSVLYIISVGLALLVVYIAHKRGCVAPISFVAEDGIYKLIAAGALGIVAASYISTGITLGLSTFIESDLLVASNVSADSWNYSTAEKLCKLIAVSVGAPIVEEIIFRGALLGAMKKTFKTGTAVVITSVVFGLLHRTSLLAILGASLSGIVLAYIYLASGSLLCSICLHSWVNLAVNVKAFWLTKEVSVEGVKGGISTAMELSDMQLALLFIVIGTVSAITFAVIIKRRLSAERDVAS